MNKIGICTGGFDPVQPGHIAMFRDAKNHVDYLCAFLNSDEWLARKKGKPFMKMEDRVEIFRGLKDIDYIYSLRPEDDKDGHSCIAIERTINAFGGHEKAKFFFINGGDRTEQNTPEKEFAKQNNVEMLYNIGGNKVQSSSWLLNNWKNNITERPWGYFNVLQDTTTYKVKELFINPGKSISLQYHNKREEHWTIISGKGYVYIDGNVYTAKPGETFTIPKTKVHKITNTGEENLCLIEVQTGEYFGEDDIIRIK